MTCCVSECLSGPNAEILRNAGAEKLVTDLRDNNPTDEYLRKDCEGFLLRLQGVHFMFI